MPPSVDLPEIKVGIEQSAVAISATSRDAVPPDFVATMAKMVRRRTAELMPYIGLDDARADLCYYTVTPDSKHVIRRLGPTGQITLVSACSGHGFKYAPAIAEKILTEICTKKQEGEQ